MGDFTDLLVKRLRDVDLSSLTPAGYIDTLRTIGGGLAAQIPAGYAGMYKAIMPGEEWAGAKAVEHVREALTPEPQTEAGKQNLQDMASAVQAVPNIKLPSGFTVGETLAPGKAAFEKGASEHPLLASGAVAAASVLDPRKVELMTTALRDAGRVAMERAAVPRPAGAAAAQRGALDFSSTPSSEVAAAPEATAAITSARTPTVERSAKGLAPLREAGEGDIARSLQGAYKDQKRIPQQAIDEALVNRAELRSEPSTLPKPAAEMTDQDWLDWGQQHGVDMSRTPSKSLGISDLTTRREIEVPGGLEGKFTIPDLFQIKARNFDPNALPQDVHNALMQKFIRTYDRPGGMDPVDKFNALNFSLLSPNAPLTPNEFLAQRLRVRTPEELGKVAEGSPEFFAQQEKGVGAASRGGLGVKGTADLGNQQKLAQLLRDDAQIFDPGEGETLKDVGRRTMNQVPGLGPKTASLGVPWLDLKNANTSAVDLHMIRNNYSRLLQDPDLGPQFTQRMTDLMGIKPMSADALLAKGGSDPAFNKQLEEAAIKIIGGDQVGMKYRLAGGELNPRLHPSIHPEKLAYEPEHAVEFNPFYNKVVDYVDESRGKEPDLSLFPEQWRLWDRYRQRVEPHEMAHPDFRNLPRMSFDELQQSLGAHREAGYLSKGTAGQGDVPWGRLYYGKADPMLLGGLAAGTGGAAALVKKLREDGKQQ